ncbi:substance-P receptor-like [Orbicella faveolata]|uniref:substance-P receptor-like n=1 Tax=Orbicella faveolata TaxID=48498 RepID=UPI0009E4C85A|nr:substance-P receptor-like [Orbicella faveolata]
MGSAENIAFTIMYLITMLVSLVGNILLIYIVWKRPDVRSLTSFMFVNMAVADLLVTLVVIPYTISDFYTHGVWPMAGLTGEITCKTVLFIAFFTISTSIICLTFMAVDRFYAVVYPFRRLLWFRRPKILTPLVWILSMAFMCIVPVLADFNSKNQCVFKFSILGGATKATRVLYIYFFIINYLFPVIIISILYTITARKLWFHEVPGDVEQNRQQQQMTKRKVLRMLIIVFSVFALCWLPGQVFQLYLAVTEGAKDLPIVQVACYWFGYNNSAINPWLYICMNSRMYSAFSSMIGRKLRLRKRDSRLKNNEIMPSAIDETQDTHL